MCHGKIIISATELLHQVPDAVTSVTIAEIHEELSFVSDSATEVTDIIAQKV